MYEIFGYRLFIGLNYLALLFSGKIVFSLNYTYVFSGVSSVLLHLMKLFSNTFNRRSSPVPSPSMSRRRLITLSAQIGERMTSIFTNSFLDLKRRYYDNFTVMGHIS